MKELINTNIANEPVLKTHILHTSHLNEVTNCEVYLVSELCQVTGSFKFRAAWNVVSKVDNIGFLAASSGNFGQALACASQMQGRKCTVVMPDNSARVKINAVKSYGANVDLIDVNQISRSDRVLELAKLMPDYYVCSAYDDQYVVEGNATLGAELSLMLPDLDAIIVPIGGGGLASGIIYALSDAGLEMEVWGVEPLEANDAAKSFRTGKLMVNEVEPNTLADGARTLSLGNLNFDILRTGLKGIIEVTEDLIPLSMKHAYKCGLRLEPTGALSIAALLSAKHQFRNKKVGCVLSGGNVDDELYFELLGL